VRLLIYGMQSSGASTLAFLLAQKERCAAFVDIWAPYAAPSLQGEGDVVAKVVITTAFPIALHRERLQPDCTILFLRHPEVNYRSLATKVYRHHCGLLEEKFAVLDAVFKARHEYDAILYYEDMVSNPRATLTAITQLGWSCSADFLRLERKPADIMQVNEDRYPEVVGRLEYGMGNYHGRQLSQGFAHLQDLPEPGQEVCRWCPALTEHYHELIRTQQRWGVGT